MAVIVADRKIAATHDNAGNLTLITSLTDADSVPLIMPEGVGSRNRGERRFRTDRTAGRVGKDSKQWTSNMLIAQYKFLIDTYESVNNGQVTIRIALTSVTFANYNASLWLPDEDELEYVHFSGSTTAPDFVGPGYSNVPWNFTDLVAL